MVKKNVDVLVVGGGVSGVCAAIASKRSGIKSVAIIESSTTVGGIATEGPLEALMTFHDENGQVIRGIASEIVDRLVSLGGSPGFVIDTVGYCKTLVPYDSEILRLVLFEMLQEAGVDIWLNSLLTAVKKFQNKIVEATVIGNSSSEVFSCKAIIDASGGAEVARLAGAEVLFGRNLDQMVQPMSTLCKVAGVDVDSLRIYVKDNIDTFQLAQDVDVESPFLHLWGFEDVLKRGYHCGAISLKRKELQLMVTPRKGEVILNFSRFSGNPRSLRDVSYAQIITIRQCHELVAWLRKNIESFKNAHVVHTGKLGIRESRRVKGIYELQPEDILEQRSFEHVVARGAFPVDIHQPDGDSLISKKIAKSYSIPMECLMAERIPNLFMCGRCICASHEALASARITATAMATGHAAGVLAAFYAHTGQVRYSEVCKELLAQKAIL